MLSARCRTVSLRGAARSLAWLLAAAAVQPAIVLEAQSAAAGPPGGGPWDFAVSYALRETFDGNVYLQDLGGMARRGSLVTSAAPGLALSFRSNQDFLASFNYSPEIVRFHGHAAENHVTHRAGAVFAGVSGATAWELTSALTGIAGPGEGPVFETANLCDIPAVGGIPLRDRRAATIMRHGFKLTRTAGRWFVRPSFTAYLHDFRTRQYARTGAYAGYENYIGRWELSGGADLGYAVGEKTWLVAGHRSGRQQQGRLLGAPSPYSNSYHRLLAGIEGSPAGWLRLNVLAGPDMRRFARRPAGFDTGELLWFIQASASWLPDAANAVTLTLSRFEQPAFSSHSVYEDLVYDVSWRRRHGKRLSFAAGLRIYGGDWQAPVNREDWIYTPTASVTCTLHKRLAAEAAWSYDAARSRIPNTGGREYTRPMFSVGLRGTL